MFTDLRLKILHFLKKNSKIIFIVICVWVVLFFINSFLKNYNPKVELQTTYEPHTSVMNDKEYVPKKVGNDIEDMLEEYTSYCFEGNVESAYNMLSDVCKEYMFENSLTNFTEYILEKTNGSKKYAIQDFSNNGNKFIYQIKYSADFLATGLNEEKYNYTEEKIVFEKKKNGEIDMAVGDFVDFQEIKNISESNYLKIDVKAVIKYYTYESYIVKLTNRSDNTIVISDGQSKNEVFLQLVSTDARDRMDLQNHIILQPNESKSVTLEFPKHYDNNDDSKNIVFGSIRVMEKYSGTDVDEAIIQSEIQNAIDKFSITIPVKSNN